MNTLVLSNIHLVKFKARRDLKRNLYILTSVYFGWIPNPTLMVHYYSIQNKSMERCKERYNLVMKLLIRRYVTAEQRNREDFGVTEDDVMEIRQDISSLRYELIDILRQNGMTTPKIASDEVLCEYP